MSLSTIKPLKPIKNVRRNTLLVFIILTLLPLLAIGAQLLTDPFVVDGTTTQATYLSGGTGLIFHTVLTVQFTDTHGMLRQARTYAFHTQDIGTYVTIRYETNHPEYIESESIYEYDLYLWLVVAILLTGTCCVLIWLFRKEL